MRVAVLGMGRMGQAVAGRVLGGGHEVLVWNRSKGKADRLVEQGATEARSLAEAVRAAETVISCLANDDAVEETALGPGGVRSSIGDRTYVDASTVSPALGAALGRAFERYVALPILGAPEAVHEGRATYLAGGRPDTVKELEPVLAALGGTVKRFERPELALAAKLSVNLLLLSGIATLAEALTVGRAGGLSDEQLVEVLVDSPMLAPGLKNRLAGVAKGSGPVRWTTGLAAKDARLAVALAAAAGKGLRIGPTLVDLYQGAADSGFDDQDMVAVACLYR